MSRVSSEHRATIPVRVLRDAGAGIAAREAWTAERRSVAAVYFVVIARTPATTAQVQPASAMTARPAYSAATPR